jgi:hypothetical protein
MGGADDSGFLQWIIPNYLPWDTNRCTVTEQQIVVDAGQPIAVPLGTNQYTATGLAGGTHMIHLRLRDDAGTWHEWTVSVEVQAPPTTPPGRPALTIPAYARGASVRITIPDVPSGVEAYRVSTSSSFEGVAFTPLDGAIATSALTAFVDSIDRDGPMTVFAQFRGANGVLSEVTQASVTVDRTAPIVTTAVATIVAAPRSRAHARAPFRAHRITIAARDKTSGVQSVQITTSRAKPGMWRRYTRTTRIRSRALIYFVRVRDRAGNFGKWRTVRVVSAKKGR